MEKVKLAPVQVWSLPEGYKYAAIPWEVHEKAYQKYSLKYGYAQSIERIAQRGGFGDEEIREFYPEWDGVILLAKQYSENIEDWVKFNTYQTM